LTPRAGANDIQGGDADVRYRALHGSAPPYLQSLQKNRGEKMQNLRRIYPKIALKMSENCAENALKLRAICASCTQIEQKNPRKIADFYTIRENI